MYFSNSSGWKPEVEGDGQLFHTWMVMRCGRMVSALGSWRLYYSSVNDCLSCPKTGSSGIIPHIQPQSWCSSPSWMRALVNNYCRQLRQCLLIHWLLCGCYNTTAYLLGNSIPSLGYGDAQSEKTRETCLHCCGILGTHSVRPFVELGYTEG